MRRTGRWLAIAAIGAGCATAAGDSEDPPQTPAGSGDTFARIVNVEVQAVVPTSFENHIRITGEAEALHDVTLAAEESGVITEFLVEKGHRVAAGDVVARIDSRSLAAQVDEARASTALADEQHERQRRLWEDEGMGTEIAYLQTKYQAEIAKARLTNLEVRLAKTEIRSPVPGVFDDRFLEAGEIALAGSQIARIVSIDRVKIVGGVPERFASIVTRGDAARITFDILPGRTFPGVINYVGATVNERSRTFPIEIVIANLGGSVKPNMVANVQLVADKLREAIVVSRDVIRRSESGYHVFVVGDRDGAPIARARPVVLGPSTRDLVVIMTGIEAGERLITRGSQLVDDDSRIRIINPPAAGSSGGDQR